MDFRTSNYFSWHVHVLAVCLIFIALTVFQESIWGGLAILVPCAIIFTTHYRLQINLDNNEYRDYLWILGLKDGKPHRFEKLEYFFIKINNVSQTMGLKAANTTVVKQVCDVYLKFSDDEKLHVMTANRKEIIVKNFYQLPKAWTLKYWTIQMEKLKKFRDISLINLVILNVTNKIKAHCHQQTD